MIIANVLVASIAITNVAALSTRAIEVTTPEKDAVTWSLDISNERILVQTEFQVKNNALYDIRDVDVEATLFLDNETELVRYRTEDLIIPRMSDQPIPVTASLYIPGLPFERLASLVLLDADISLHVRISASYMWGLGDFDMDQTIYYHWESPLKQAILTYLEEQGLEDLCRVIEDAASGADMDGFYNAFNSHNIKAALDMFGIRICLDSYEMTNETITFHLTAESGGSLFRMSVTIPIYDPPSMKITLEEVILNV
ncbi:MAG: hypothetical protein KAT70_05900 [Thermoplasmata archaeon]|nr:hypothetical protein [Thermoplasmata archaeon]